MNGLTGGKDVYTFMCKKDDITNCCGAMCSCLALGWFSETTASIGDYNASSAIRPFV